MKRVLFLVFLGLGLRANASTAATYEVRPDGSGDFPTIAAAVQAASAGDIIELADGTFTGTGNRDVSYAGKAITIRSRSGDRNRCIIDCEGSSALPHRAFLFEHSETALSVLEGVTITHAWHIWGGGIHCMGSSVRARIVNCSFVENTAASSEGGGICAENDAAPSIEGCLFRGNTAACGGAVSFTNGFGGAVASLIRCTIYGNVGGSEGGGVRT